MRRAEYAKRLLRGIADAALSVIIYLYLVPELFSRIYNELGYAPQQGIGPSMGAYVALAILISGLHLAGSLLKGSIFEPLLRASANMFGVIYVLYFMGSGNISVENIPLPGSEDMYVDVELGLGPLIAVFFAFFVAPGVVTPFIEYFLRAGED